MHEIKSGPVDLPTGIASFKSKRSEKVLSTQCGAVAEQLRQIVDWNDGCGNYATKNRQRCRKGIGLRGAMQTPSLP
ncbi:hypothetical protein [Variovorax sp. AFSI2.2]|uniref:hypothetical protein n=1 Tax=Variovorax sp. AFSI2.2 TaxID=3384160 RepID=UPI003EB8DD83